MRIVACQRESHLQGITTKPPLGIDLVAEEGAPFTVTFDLFDDPTATNLRGLWMSWSEYEQGEVTYLTPEGPESGDTSERTPSAIGAWVARRRTQHAKPGAGESKLFWIAMEAMDLTGKTAAFVVPGNETLNATGTISEGNIQVDLTSVQTALVPTSLPYRLEVREGPSTLFYAARGQIIFRSSGEPESEPPLVAESGETFEATIKLWKDAAHTKRQTLVGWTAQLVIDGVKTLTEGHGLTVTDAVEGELTLTMSAAEATEFAPRSTRCTLAISKEEDLVTMFNRQFLFLP